MSIHAVCQRIVYLFLVLVVVVPASATATGSFTIGVVPQFDARRIHTIWQPILTYLEQETGYGFRLAGAPTITAFEKEFVSGHFDFAYMNPYHLIMANREQGYLPLVRDVGRQLFGVLVVSKHSGITEVQQLDGREIAFPAPNALGASLMMRQELSDDFGIRFTPRYVKTHDSVYLNVLLAETAAGGGVQKTLDRQKSAIKENLQILHTTRPVAPHPIAYHPRIDKAVAEKVAAALLKMGQSDDGKKALAAIPMKKIGPAHLSDYRILETMGLERFHVRNW